MDGNQIGLLLHWAGQVLVWVGIAITRLVNQEWFEVLWQWLGELPTVAVIIMWVMFLPIMVGLWIIDSYWSAIIRLVGFAGMVVWTLAAASSLVRAAR